MKKIFILIVLALCAMPSLAQNPKLSVKLDAASMQAVQRQKTVDKKWGYTVCIFADNGQNARSQANVYLTKIRNLLPYEPSKLEYENPFFKVYVGECYERSEAVRLIGLIKGIFPKAVIAVKEFNLQSFAEVRDSPLYLMDSVSSENLSEIGLGDIE